MISFVFSSWGLGEQMILNSTILANNEMQNIDTTSQKSALFTFAKWALPELCQIIECLEFFFSFFPFYRKMLSGDQGSKG